MSFFEILGTVLIKPLELVFEVIYMLADKIVGNEGLAIIALSVCMNILVLPLYKRADAMQAQQQQTELALHRGVAHIKKAFKGDERMLMLQTYYRQNNYKPTYVLRGATSLLLEIPFFIAAYRFLSGLSILQGVSFGPIADLGKPDGLLHIAGLTINLLPIVMTVVNLISCVIFTKGSLAKTKIQLYGMAIFFLFFLYTSPSGLVFYWTLNNVFSLAKTAVYKLKYADITVRILCALAGSGIVVYGFCFYPYPSWRRLMMFALLGIALLAPLVIFAVKKAMHGKKTKMRTLPPPNKKLFFGAMAYLAAFTGLLIPSTIIKASPQEFVDVTVFYHPAWYIVSAACFAFGTFVVWAGIFYWLASERAKIFFERGAFLLCGAVTVDYMFFGRNLGIISSSLQYDHGLVFAKKEMLLNLGVLCLVGIAFYFLARLLSKHLHTAVLVGTAALCCMGIFNVAGVNKTISEYLANERLSDETPSYTVSKNGKNVIVMMVDRGIAAYLPYLFNEKPELQEKFAGFTVYNNTVSFGKYTLFGAPALFGGYEYTPAKINARSGENLVDKHNEALLMMPRLFSESGFQVTVFDPPFAGYQWIPDMTIYDEYPEIRAFVTKGTFTDPSLKHAAIENNRRNFFCFGIMKSSPLVLQRVLYDGGNYNRGGTVKEQKGYDGQVITGPHTAQGLTQTFMDPYNALCSLPDLMRVEDNASNNLLVLSSDVTHDPIMLQEGEYVPQETVDNREYEAQNADRFTVNGITLGMLNDSCYTHYQCNMAALLRIADWLDALRAAGVYDNTRIIITSDHGTNGGQIQELIQSDGFDAEGCYPYLMVKDFDSDTFSWNDTFMTNADVPTLATNGLIAEPVNPFTGNAINSDDKTAHVQYVFNSAKYDPSMNPGPDTFVPGDWYTVHDDIWNKDNWKLAAVDTVLTSED